MPLATMATRMRAAVLPLGRARGVALAIVLATLAPGCATIMPYERERLAQPDMQLGSSPELALAEGHATEVREGAAGGMGGGGGGCGCN